MYAYVMRPDTIDSGYYRFIRDTGPIVEVCLQGVRDNTSGHPVNMDDLVAYVRKASGQSGAVPLSSPYPDILGCNILHPMSTSCTQNGFRVLLQSFRRVLPVYGTLTLVTTVFLKASRLLRSPVPTAIRAMTSALRSTAFLTWLITSYQLSVCLFRKLFNRDHRYEYWVAGAISGLSLLIEEKGRRSELALYTLPRAMDSLLQLAGGHFLPSWFDVVIFTVATSGLMYLYENEPDTVPPFLRWAIHKLVHSHKPSVKVD